MRLAAEQLRVGDHAFVVRMAGIPDLEQHVPGDPVPIGARRGKLGVERGQPFVVQGSGRGRDFHSAQRQVGHRSSGINRV